MYKVALVYDRANTPYGGAENVLLALHEIFPDAPLFTSVYNPSRAQWAKKFKVIPSFLNDIPFAKYFHRSFVPFMPLAFESFDFSAFDVIISVTSAEAKGILTQPHQLHLCYLLTPTRYLWSHAEEYQSHWLTGELRKDIFDYLRWWDQAAALRPDVIVPISNVVAKRCEFFYNRIPEKVIYPAVSPLMATLLENAEPTRLSDKTIPEQFYLIVSRLVPYKRVDLAIEACLKMGKNLVVVGEGPDFNRLQNLAEEWKKENNWTGQVFFRQSVQDAEVIAYYQNCRAFLAPAAEDFGMTVVEAQAAGKPVIVYAESGGAETVIEGETGVHFLHQTLAGLVEALYIYESLQWNAKKIQAHALNYTKEVFKKQFLQKVEEELWKRTISV